MPLRRKANSARKMCLQEWDEKRDPMKFGEEIRFNIAQ